MTRITATVDDQGRLTLPEHIARTLHAGQTLTVELEVESVPTSLQDFIGSLPPLDVDSHTYYRRERGHDE